jgi:hypothetical protein
MQIMKMNNGGNENISDVSVGNTANTLLKARDII